MNLQKTAKISGICLAITIAMVMATVGFIIAENQLAQFGDNTGTSCARLLSGLCAGFGLLAGLCGNIVVKVGLKRFFSDQQKVGSRKES